MSLSTVIRYLVIVALASLLLWFMGRSDEESPQPPAASTTTPAPAPATVPAPEPSPTPSTPAEPTEIEPGPDRTNPHARRAARLELAVRAARAFARPSTSTSQEQWWEQLRPHLADDYADDFTYIDPQRVPFTKISGKPRLQATAAPETLLTLVRLPTDAGDYAIEIEDAENGLGVVAIYPWQDQDDS